MAAGAAAPFSAWERSLAARYLRAKRREGGVALISIISYVGISLAVAVLIIVMSVMNGFRAELLNSILGFDGHIYVGGGVLTPPERDAAIARLRQVPGVIQVYPKVESYGAAASGGQFTVAVVRGLTPADLRATTAVSRNIKQGSLQGFGEGEYGGDLILIGSVLAQTLRVSAGDPVTLYSPSGSNTPFGSTLQEKTYTVGGVFEAGMSVFDSTFVFMPLEQAQLFFGKEPAVDSIDVRVEHPDQLRRILPAIERAAGPAAVVTTWELRHEEYLGVLRMERRLMRLILMLVVAIAFLNIISGLVMLVKNKGRDIAVLRTMGAGQGAVARVFFMSGASIGIAGTATGLLIGVLFCTFISQIQDAVEYFTGPVFPANVYYLSKLPARIEWGEVGLISGFAFLMSCLVTLPSSLRASRLDPVEALRYE